MPRPRLYKTEAIVLKGLRLGEADRLLTLLTPSLGKVRAVARGVLRPRSKLAGHLEPLTRASLMLARGRNLDIISQAQALETFPPLRCDLWRAGQALYAAELVDRFTGEGQENYPVYHLLLDVLAWLAGAGGDEVPLRYFEVRLLGHLGYRPELSRCLGCRTPLGAEAVFFSPSAGGALCPRCRPLDPTAPPISPGALKALGYLQGCDGASARRVRAGAELAREMEGLLRGYIGYLLEQGVRSVEFLERLRREGLSSAGSPNNGRSLAAPS